MPTYITVPAVAFATAILVALALGPSIWLTRSSGALKFRAIKPRKLALFWTVVVVPWVIAAIALHSLPPESISVHGVPQLIAVIAVVLVLLGVLISLPLSIIVLSAVWLLDRNSDTTTANAPRQ